jgi:hypothetical protein
MATNRKKPVLVWDISHLVGEIDCFGKCSIGKGVVGRDITHLSHTKGALVSAY